MDFDVLVPSKKVYSALEGLRCTVMRDCDPYAIERLLGMWKLCKTLLFNVTKMTIYKA